MIAVKRLSNKNGFTLIEVLVAVFIMGLGLLSIETSIGVQYYFINQNRESTLATLAAQEVIENIRGMDFDSIITADLNTKFNNVNDSRPKALSYLSTPSINVSRDQDVYNDYKNIQRISVIISWDSSGKTLQRSLFTLVTRNGIDNK